MSSHNRRAAGIRRAWGRGPIILKLRCLERRELLAASATASANSTLPDLVNSSLTTAAAVADWGQTLEVDGRVKNQGECHDDRALRGHDLCVAHPGDQPLLRADRRGPDPGGFGGR